MCEKCKRRRFEDCVKEAMENIDEFLEKENEYLEAEKVAKEIKRKMAKIIDGVENSDKYEIKLTLALRKIK